MPDQVSILDVIKRGGYEASLITTFNATLPFYEEVLLRKLVGAGCRHNVVLMDRSQVQRGDTAQAGRSRLYPAADRCTGRIPPQVVHSRRAEEGVHPDRQPQPDLVWVRFQP